MAGNIPTFSFGSTRADNAFLGNQFSGNTNINITGNSDREQISEAERLREEKRACLRSLAFAEINARRQGIDTAYPDTCEWLFDTDEFHHFRSCAGVFWIKGKPGVGKSTLMKHAWSRFRKTFFRGHLIVAYFFNARGGALEKSQLGMLRAIVYQLIQEDDALYDLFVHFFREKTAIEPNEGWSWYKSDLQEFLRQVVNLSRPQPLLLLIDALDECDEPEVREVVMFLEELSIHAKGRTSLRTCLSSRHYPSITMTIAVELTVESNVGHREDITKYLSRFEVLDSVMRSEILKKADGIFLWVVLVLSLLKRDYDEGRAEAMQKTLDDIPDDIEKLFSVILETGEWKAAETILMFQWVLLSERPLTPQELFFAVAKTTPPALDMIQRRITTASKGLIEIRKDEEKSGIRYRYVAGARCKPSAQWGLSLSVPESYHNKLESDYDEPESDYDEPESYYDEPESYYDEVKYVQFIHLSVWDFLFRQNRLQALDPTLGPQAVKTSHGRMWAYCWSCIEQAINTMSTDEQDMKESKERFPFLGYATSHILTHADKAILEDGPSVYTSRECLLNSWDVPLQKHHSFRHWLHEPGRWLQWWKMFLMATTEEYNIPLRAHLDAGLHYIAAMRGLASLVAAIPASFDMNEQGGEYGNALQAASHHGLLDIVRLLLDRGADVNALGGRDGRALQAACGEGHLKIVRLLLDRGADVNALGGTEGSALRAASHKGHVDIVHLLLDRGAAVNAICHYDGDALQAACGEGHLDVVRLLLDCGAFISVVNGYYGGALQAAYDGGHYYGGTYHPRWPVRLRPGPYLTRCSRRTCTIVPFLFTLDLTT